MGQVKGLSATKVRNQLIFPHGNTLPTTRKIFHNFYSKRGLSSRGMKTKPISKLGQWEQGTGRRIYKWTEQRGHWSSAKKRSAELTRAVSYLTNVKWQYKIYIFQQERFLFFLTLKSRVSHSFTAFWIFTRHVQCTHTFHSQSPTINFILKIIVWILIAQIQCSKWVFSNPNN